MTKVLIIEDEKPAARRLQRILEKMDLAVDGNLHSVEEAVNWFRNNDHPDLIFLDIQLSDGLSFEIFEHVDVLSSIIFTTAYDEYALKAFKLNSVDYLLKPIDKEELTAAFNKFKNSQKEKNPQILNAEALRKMLNLQDDVNYKKRFTVQVGQHLKIIETQEVSCFYSENKGTYLRSIAGRNYLIDCSLDKLELELDPSIFFRVSRKFIINIHQITDIISYTNQRLEIKLTAFKEEPVIVSRERVKSFKDWLE